MEREARFIEVGHGPWLGQVGEAELIGGWADVPLDDDFAMRIDRAGYQVFVTSDDAAPLFVQNRTEHSFEIHALPGPGGGRRTAVRCGYRVVGRRAGALVNGEREPQA